MSLVKKLSGKALIVAMAMAMLPASVAVPQNVNGAMGNVVAGLFGATQAKADPWRQRHWDRGGYRRHRRTGGRSCDRQRQPAALHRACAAPLCAAAVLLCAPALDPGVVSILLAALPELRSRQRHVPAL